jgi:membrane associated rhomboid family serine protease
LLPLKDDIPTDRLPLVTLLLIAAGAAGHILVDGGSVLQLLAGALFLWIFGTTVEDATSRPRFLALCVLAGGAAVALGRAIDPDAVWTVVAAAGAVSAGLGGYARIYPRAHVLGIAPVPFAVTLVAAPAWTLLGAWAALQAVFALTSAGGPLGDGGAALLAACAGGFALGLLAIPLLAKRRKHHPPLPLATPAVP